MGTLLIRLVAGLLLSLAAPAWSAPPDPGAVPGSCCGEACPAADEAQGSDCASCCAFTLWVGRSPTDPIAAQSAAPAPMAHRLCSQGVFSSVERPPARS